MRRGIGKHTHLFSKMHPVPSAQALRWVTGCSLMGDADKTRKQKATSGRAPYLDLWAFGITFEHRRHRLKVGNSYALFTGLGGRSQRPCWQAGESPLPLTRLSPRSLL